MRDDSKVKRRHTGQVLLRFDPEQLALINKAADQAGLNRTAWLRMTALRVAKEELGRLVTDPTLAVPQYVGWGSGEEPEE